MKTLQQKTIEKCLAQGWEIARDSKHCTAFRKGNKRRIVYYQHYRFQRLARDYVVELEDRV